MPHPPLLTGGCQPAQPTFQLLNFALQSTPAKAHSCKPRCLRCGRVPFSVVVPCVPPSPRPDGFGMRPDEWRQYAIASQSDIRRCSGLLHLRTRGRACGTGASEATVADMRVNVSPAVVTCARTFRCSTVPPTVVFSVESCGQMFNRMCARLNMPGLAGCSRTVQNGVRICSRSAGTGTGRIYLLASRGPSVRCSGTKRLVVN